MTDNTARTTRWRLIAASAITAVVSLGVCEALGWPFLAQPIQRWLSATLERRISFSEDPAAHPRVIIHLLGGLAITAPYIEIGAPAWSAAPHLLLARDARLQLGYADLWRARGDAPLRLRGSFADPDVGLDKGKLGTRLGASVLLAFVNPLAALIPLFDIGNSADAKRG